MFDPRDIKLWIEDEQLGVRVPAVFTINDRGELVVTTSQEIASLAQYIVNEEEGTIEVRYLAGHGRDFDIDISKWIPKFIMADKNGNAVARAIETGLTMMNGTIQDGVASVLDPDLMPEWALDEKAWEYNITYDPAAPIETKRGWIKDAFKMYQSYGTAAGIKKFLEHYFGGAEVKEWYEYEGDPCHFTVSVPDLHAATYDAWVEQVTTQIKKAGSVLDEINYVAYESDANIYTKAAVIGIEIIGYSTPMSQ